MLRKNNISKEKQKNKNVNLEEPLIPFVRFKNFEYSWIESRLDKICSIQDGTHSTPLYTESGVPFFSVETITSNVQPKFISKEEHQKLIKRCKPKINDILLTRIGTLAKSKIIDWDYEFSIYVSLALLGDIKINSKFLNQYLQTEYYQKDFLRKSLLLAVPPKINLKDLKETKIKYPSLKEQEKIANFLSNVDKKIELLEKTLVLYQHLESLRFELIHDKNLTTHSFKLKEICEIKKGKQLNKSNMIENGKYYVLNGGKETSGFTNTWNVKENTITISEGGNSCGFVSFNTEKFFCGGHCYYLTLKNYNINLNYLFNYLKSIETKIMKLRVGSGLPNIQKKDIEFIKLNIPSLSKQEHIGKLLKLYTLQLNSKNQELFLLNDFKKGLLQKMFI